MTLRAFLTAGLIAGFSAVAVASPVEIVDPNTNRTGTVPVVSAASATSLVAKAAPGTQMSVYVTNLSATPGFLVGYNAASVPTDGALSGALVQDCVPIGANATASINDSPGPGTFYSVGIVYFLTVATSCYTKTTGALTGFIKAKVQ